jgi:hypothetical protein
MTIPVLPAINTPVSATDTGKMLPPWYRYFFQNQNQITSNPLVFDIRNYDVSGTDITTALRQARDAAADAGGGIIWIPEGDWQTTITGAEPNGAFGFPSVVNLPDNVSVVGTGYGSSISLTANTADINLFSYLGTGGVQSYTLQSDAAKGDYFILITSAVGLPNDGDFVVLETTDAHGNTWNATFEVKSTNASPPTIEFFETLPFPMAVANSPLIYQISMLQGGGIKNLRLQGYNVIASNQMTGIAAQNTQNQVFDHLWLEGWGYGNQGIDPTGLLTSAGGIILYQGRNNIVTDCHSSYSGTRLEDGLSLWRQTDLFTDNLVSTAQIGFGIGYNICSDIQVGSIFGSGHSVLTARAIKFQGVVRSTIDSVTSIRCRTTGLAVALGCEHNLFGNVLLRGDPAGDGSGASPGLWLNGQYNTKNTFAIVDSRYFQDGDVGINSTDTENVIGILTDTDPPSPNPNIIEASTTIGIYNGSPVGAQPTTVANLPSATDMTGKRRMVNNANATTFNSIVAGGGANIVPVFSDGTNWRIG